MLLKFKWVIFIIIASLIISIAVIFKIYNKNSIDLIETAIIYMYREDVNNTLKYLNKASYDKEIYEIVNLLSDEEILNEFYKNKELKSFGYAELRSGTILLLSNKIGEGIEKLKLSSSQDNIKAQEFLANYLYSLKRYKEAFDYYEMSYNNKNYNVYSKYIEMKNNYNEYIYMEELFLKYKQNNITDNERLQLGKFLIYKNEIVDAYQVLRIFLETNNFEARLAKALYLETELDNEESLNEYKKLFLERQEPIISLKIAQKSSLKTKKSREKILELLEKTNSYNEDVEFMKANILYENDDFKEALEIYQNLSKNNYIDAYDKLANYYENNGEYEKALNMYEKSFLSGKIHTVNNMYDIIKENKINNIIIDTNEMKEYLKIATMLNDENASYSLANLESDIALKKKYALLSFARGNLRALELLIDIASIEKNKEKIRVYTNILVNNR